MESFEKSVKKFEKHLAYKQEDLEIKNEQELKVAKKAAGVTTHEEAMDRLRMDEMGKETREIITLFEEVFEQDMRHGDEIQGTGFEEHPNSIEILLSNVGQGTDYISYPIEDASKDKFETLPPLMGAVGTSVESESSPEGLIQEFQRIIRKRDELIKDGYEVNECDNPDGKGIYELNFSKTINDIEGLKDNLKKLKDILEGKE
ncbi:MAG: hypothetical protein M0P97_04620 [Candidatus Moranbacteria bacterium]|jgi:hypothetical protein|nr:hypothetical protein [Candidatus Moranbacteria bacterium]